ncbi:MAG: tetratricopeptide repeat protein [Burkholderiales bacterium]|nr:tetratricopeptide repeat protein [Burkholderiales bacterium]
MSVTTVTTADFDEQVLRASASRPVLVDFWAPWCAPCRALAPVLERVAAEFGDRMTLVKVNSDEEPQIAARYGVRGIPNCKLFVAGEVADEFTGALPESAVRAFLLDALPSPAAPWVAAAAEHADAGEHEAALTALDRAFALDPDDERALLLRIEVLLALGRIDEARVDVGRLDARRRPLRDPQRLAALAARAALAEAGSADIAGLARAAATDPVDCAAKLAYARALAAAGEYERALPELLAIVRTDRSFGDDVGRRTMLTVFAALPADSDLVRRYRRELAAALN